MRLIAKIGCCVAMLPWMYSAGAGEVVVNENADAVVLESAPVSVSAPPEMPASSMSAAAMAASASSVPAAPEAAPAVTKIPVKLHYDKVDRARVEQRIEDRSARTKKRNLEAEKDVADRAAKARQDAEANDPAANDQGASASGAQ